MAASKFSWLTFQYAADSTQLAVVTKPKIAAKTILILRVKIKKVKRANPYRVYLATSAGNMLLYFGLTYPDNKVQCNCGIEGG